MLVEILIGVGVVLASIYVYLTRNYDYWKKKGVVYIESQFPLGVVQDNFMGRTDAGSMYQKFYTKYKAEGHKYVGAFVTAQPILLIFDLDLTKQILTKDFHHFTNRDFAPLTHEFISKHLFALEGQEWKEMRTKLTPTFTSGKMKTMFTLMERCVGQLQEHIDSSILKQGEFEVKDLIVRFTTDIIATCAFGLEVNSITDRENEFYKTGQLIFKPSKAILFKIFMFRNFPKLAELLNINFVNPTVPQILKKIIEDTIEYRKKNNVVRNDFIDLLLKVKENKNLEDEHEDKPDAAEQERTSLLKNFLKYEKKENNHHNKERLTIEEMTAQAFAFFAAGFETAASTTSFCLYELAKHPEVQDRLRREIDEVLDNHGGKVTYQAIQEMTYMDQVMNETLRLYASLPVLTRKCTERYHLPGTDLVLEKGVRMEIPVYAFHHDPDIYPDPDNFDPERFTEENIRSRHNYSFIPFGEGPRICIGMRFGKLQVKLGLVAILSKYELSLPPGTPTKLEINPHIVATTPKHSFSLRIVPRTDKTD